MTTIRQKYLLCEFEKYDIPYGEEKLLDPIDIDLLYNLFKTGKLNTGKSINGIVYYYAGFHARFVLENIYTARKYYSKAINAGLKFAYIALASMSMWQHKYTLAERYSLLALKYDVQDAHIMLAFIYTATDKFESTRSFS